MALPITNCEYCGRENVPTINTNGVSRMCEKCVRERGRDTSDFRDQFVTGHIADQDVEEIIHRAVCAACNVLDERFPGHEHSGVNSNFAGVLEETIGSLLCGYDPRQGRSTYLHRLVRD